jgi:hypothetical protein
VGKLLSNIQVGIEDDERNAVFQLFKNERKSSDVFVL